MATSLTVIFWRYCFTRSLYLFGSCFIFFTPKNIWFLKKCLILNLSPFISNPIHYMDRQFGWVSYCIIIIHLITIELSQKNENKRIEKKNLNRTKFGAHIPSRELVLQKDESQYVFTVANWTFLKWLQKYFQDYQNAIFSRPWLSFLFAFFDD